MRIFSSCAEAQSEVKREVAEMGKEVKLNTYQDKIITDNPKFFTKELLAYSYMIHEPTDEDILIKGDEKWAYDDFAERISGMKYNPGKAWKERESVWKEFLDSKGKFSYTYSERIASQLEKIIKMLESNEHARNAIVSIWDREIDQDRIGGKKRVPCSMYYQFLIRNNKVHLIYNIRSNDVITHWRFDVWMAIKMQKHVAEKLGKGTGDFYQFIGSLHAYEKDLRGIF